MMRLDKYLINAGKGTRSQVKRLIAKGCVRAGGTPVMDPGFKIASEKTDVCIDGRSVRYAAFGYYMLNKPIGVIVRRRTISPDQTNVRKPGS